MGLEEPAIVGDDYWVLGAELEHKLSPDLCFEIADGLRRHARQVRQIDNDFAEAEYRASQQHIHVLQCRNDQTNPTLIGPAVRDMRSRATSMDSIGKLRKTTLQ